MKNIILFRVAFTIIFSLNINLSYVDFTAKVYKVVDGDTIHVENKYGKKFKVRLTGIDAPERGQPYGLESTYKLRELLLNKLVLGRQLLYCQVKIKGKC